MRVAFRIPCAVSSDTAGRVAGSATPSRYLTHRIGEHALRRYFYHCFPRRREGDGIAKGLAMLESIAGSGLLLTPEKLRVSESERGGRSSVFQKRVCFTELRLEELAAHSDRFGPFAIEWEVATLRRFGACPVFYVPLVESSESMEGIGRTLLSRLGDAQFIVQKLADLSALASSGNPSDQLRITRGGKDAGATRATLGAAADITAVLQADVRPAEEVAGALRALFSLFYPTEDLDHNEELGYYRDREWRIVGNMLKNGVAVSDPPSPAERSRLLDLDAEFFGRVVEFPSGEHPRVDQCQFLRAVQGVSPLAAARRVIVPECAAPRVREILHSHELDVAVECAEKLPPRSASGN